MQTRVEVTRPGWAHRSGGHWFELGLPSVELGPGGPRRQSVTAAIAPRLLRGRDDEGRIEGAVQLRFHLWRAHWTDNLWAYSDRRFDASDPDLRRVPCGNGFHVYEYDGRGYVEAFSLGVLFEGMITGSGRWVPDGYDARGRVRDTLSDLQLDGGFAGGVFARFTSPIWLSLSVDAGWEYAYGEGGPYLRAGLGLPFDLSVDRTQPRLTDRP